MDRMSCPQDTPSGGDDSELGPDAHVGCRWRGIFETNPMRGVRQGSSRLARGGPRNRAANTTLTLGWSLDAWLVPMAGWNRDGPAMANRYRTRLRPRSASVSHEAPRVPFFGTEPRCGPRSAQRRGGRATSRRTARRPRVHFGGREAPGPPRLRPQAAGSGRVFQGEAKVRRGNPPGQPPGHADWTNREDQPSRASAVSLLEQGGPRSRRAAGKANDPHPAWCAQRTLRGTGRRSL
jgi:hypothetical protein